MFLSKLKSFVNKSMLGVDIGTTAIKIAEVIPESDKGSILKNYGILTAYKQLERSNSAIQTNALKIAEKETAEMLKKLVNSAGFSTKEAIASIPSFSAFMTILEMPSMSAVDLGKAVSFQIRQRVPMPLNEISIEWSKVGEHETPDGITQQILLTAIPLELIDRYKNIFQQAGLILRFLELENISLARILIKDDKTPALIVDIGGRSTNIIIVDGGFVKMSSFIDYAGTSLTLSIANGLGLDPRRAEELKKSVGLQVSAGSEELSTLPLPYLNAIIEEIKRQKNIFANGHLSSTGKGVEKIIFCGGGANLLGLENYIKDQFMEPTSIGNALANFYYPAEINVLVKQLGAELAVAIGLAMR